MEWSSMSDSGCMELSIKCPALAGRVAHFLANREVLTQDQWVLQTVADYQLEGPVSGQAASADEKFTRRTGPRL